MTFLSVLTNYTELDAFVILLNKFSQLLEKDKNERAGFYRVRQHTFLNGQKFDGLYTGNNCPTHLHLRDVSLFMVRNLNCHHTI